MTYDGAPIAARTDDVQPDQPTPSQVMGERFEGHFAGIAGQDQRRAEQPSNPPAAPAEERIEDESPVASLVREQLARSRHLGLSCQLEEITGHRLAGLWHLLAIAREQVLHEEPDSDRNSALNEATMLYLGHIGDTLEAIRREVSELERRAGPGPAVESEARGG
jgi:hypothetical protein